MSNLQGITNKLGSSYDMWKVWEKEKEATKKEFFNEVTKLLSEETPAQILEEVYASDADVARERAAKKFPRFKVLDVILDKPGVYRVALEENPAYRSFQYVNEDDGMIYQKTVVEGSAILDDDRIKEEDPEFWEEISFVPTDRQLKPLEELSSTQLAKLAEYMYAGKPTVKLTAPRKAKEEELNG